MIHVSEHRQAVQYTGSNGQEVVDFLPSAVLVSDDGNTLVFDTLDGGGPFTMHATQWLAMWRPSPGYWDLGFFPIDDADFRIGFIEIPDAAAVQAHLDTPLAVQTASGVTDAAGDVTLTWPVPFAAVPHVTIGLQAPTSEVHSTLITARTTATVTVNVKRSPQVSLLGIDILGATVPAQGVTVDVMGIAA